MAPSSPAGITPYMRSRIQIPSFDATPRPSDTARPRTFALVAGLTAFVLAFTANDQIYDTNFYSLWEATALLAGDRPYRDFYEWGIPLRAVVSALAQLLVGYRLIGEFGVQWLFIVGGVLISFHVGVRLSHSVAASLVTSLLAVVILAATPTYHYPHLFFYPLAIWLAWRYLDRPSARRGAALGVTTAVAFLFRHDHGVYIAGAALLAFGLACLTGPFSRNLRPVIQHVSVYAAASFVILAPWLLVVHRSEGLAEYVRMRAVLYRDFSAHSPYRRLLTSPVRALTPEELPPGDAAVNAEGFEAGLVRASRAWLPAPENAQIGLYQISVVIPILLLVAAALTLLRRRSRTETVPLDTAHIIVAAALLAVIENRLFREPSYFVAVAPLTAALGARGLAGAWRAVTTYPLTARYVGFRTTCRVAGTAMIVGLLFITSVTALGYARDTGIFEPIEHMQMVPTAFQRLLTSPPIDFYQPADAALRVDSATWNSGDLDKGDKSTLVMRYLHDCTRAGDRILVAGPSPLHVAYLVGRPIAGGHQFWRDGWRSDAVHEAQSLALLETQSVPFAFSTHDPILELFRPYPGIRGYLVAHYVELEGSDGLLLVDTRRHATGRFGQLGFPCFR